MSYINVAIAPAPRINPSFWRTMLEAGRFDVVRWEAQRRGGWRRAMHVPLVGAQLFPLGVVLVELLALALAGQPLSRIWSLDFLRWSAPMVTLVPVLVIGAARLSWSLSEARYEIETARLRRQRSLRDLR